MAEDATIEGKDLGAIIANEIRVAKRYADTELADKRVRAIEYLRGEMRDVPPRPNGSTVVSRDVADTMHWILPGVIRVFTASDNMALYEPATEADVEGAQQATDYVNFVFFRDNDGYRTLYNATYDSLSLGNGVVRHYWDPTPITEVSFHTGLNEMQLAILAEEKGVEILAQEQGEPIQVPMTDPMTGEQVIQELPTFNVKVRRETQSGKICVDACVPENLYLDSEATTIEEARFVAYLHDDKTRSDLLEMGFDPEIVESLPADSWLIDREEDHARDGDTVSLRTDVLHSTQLIDLYEAYVKADVDEDGVAELVQVWYGGAAGAGKVLAWEVWEDDIPYSDIPCYPVPHRWEAESVADRTMDIQRIKTVLLRQALDNLYASNLPMREVEVGSVENPDILANPRFGGTIWKKKQTAPIVSHAVPFVADKAFTAMGYLDEVVAKRTGVSRTTMALDPEALQNQTAEASRNARDAGYSQIELIARNQAELGWTRVFKQLLKLIVKHQDRPRVIRLRDKFIEMDPRHWNANMDVSVNVGLGTGSRDRDMAMLNTILNGQVGMADRLAAGGMRAKAIEFLPKIRNTAVKIAESAGLKNPDEYYPDITPEELQQMVQQASQPQPNPDVVKAQMQAQIDQQKAQAQMQLDQAKMQADAERSANELALKREQIDAELRLKREQLAAEIQLKREQMAAELSLKRELGMVNASVKASTATSNVAVGGDPG